MLHNLLGVDSSMIDKIFEARDSAASLLGVGKSATAKTANVIPATSAV